MAITKLRIKNFKGIDSAATFDIRPITLLLGRNSSGKSSVIHAIAALSQTVKLPSSGRPLVLDDENAHVHLGRFIEVIHTKKYTDAISVGFDAHLPDGVDRRGYTGFDGFDAGGNFSVDYQFRSTRRTQDVYLERLAYGTPNATLDLTMGTGGQYKVHYKGVEVPSSTKSTVSIRPTLFPADMKAREDFDAYLFNEVCGDLATKELANVLYLGPFRQSPRRRYPTHGANPREVGAQGESTVTMFANEHVQTKKRPRIAEVSKWLTDLSLAKKVEVSRLGRSDMFDVEVELEDGESLPIADLGYGMSQVLPVLAQCSFAPPGSTLLFEQPELHLHTSSALKLGRVLVEVAQKKKVSIVAESHSRELMIGMLDEIREGRLNLADLAVYTVTREGGESVFKRVEIEVDDKGRPECEDPWHNAL